MSLLNVGARALLANQSALQTVGHNIANVNTPGYSRQLVVQESVKGLYTGGGYIGNGVNLVTIQRSHNELLTRQGAAADAVKAADTVRADRMRQVQDIFSGGPEGLGAGINDMMNSLADVVSAPTDLTARTVFLTRADETALRLNAAAGQLDAVESSVDEGLQNGVKQVNTIAPQIAALNQQITNAKGNGQSPNDLLDQRDQLIRDLNQYVQTTQLKSTDGSISLFVASSQPLVMGNTASTISVKDRLVFGGGTDNKALYLKRPGESVDIELNDSMLGGGEVAGLIRFQNGELTEARNLLGRLTVGVAQTLNEQNQRGLTLDGEQGSELFSLPTLTDPLGDGVDRAGTQGFSLNAGIESAVLFKESAKFVASDYKVVLDSPTTGSVIRLSDGLPMKTEEDPPSTTFDFSATGDPLRRRTNGLEFVVSGGNAGDQILFKPFATAATEIHALVASPRDLAAANPINAAMGTTNTGSLKLATLQASSVPGSQLTPPTPGTPVKLSFQAGPPATFTVDGTSSPPSLPVPASVYDPATYNPGDSVPYVSGAPITIDGWEITLQGTPAAGDTVTVSNAKDSTTNGDRWYQRDAGNARAMMEFRDQPLFDGVPLSDGYADMMAKMGTRTQTATFAAELSGNIATSLERQRSAVSGVNLDEEASKLLQYQQAYQASAKAIQVAQSVFSDLIQAVGR